MDTLAPVPFDVVRIRQDFPILSQPQARGRPVNRQSSSTRHRMRIPSKENDWLSLL